MGRSFSRVGSPLHGEEFLKGSAPHYMGGVSQGSAPHYMGRSFSRVGSPLHGEEFLKVASPLHGEEFSQASAPPAPSAPPPHYMGRSFSRVGSPLHGEEFLKGRLPITWGGVSQGSPPHFMGGVFSNISSRLLAFSAQCLAIGSGRRPRCSGSASIPCAAWSTTAGSSRCARQGDSVSSKASRWRRLRGQGERPSAMSPSSNPPAIGSRASSRA